MIKKIINFIKENKYEVIILGIVLIIAAFLRLYKIVDYMTFLGDEGRDAIIVRRFLVYFDLMLVGPGTSVGNMYLGPLYYYLIAPSLFLARFSPVGPSVFVALMGVATVFLTWLTTRQWFGKYAALIAAGLYALSPTTIIYSRSSWNPNVMPFFALLCIYSLWKIWKEEKYTWFLVLGISYAFCLQSHYLGLLLLPTIGLFFVIKSLKLKKENLIKPFVKNAIIGTIIFLFLMSPLVIFDARHGFRNYSSIKTFFTDRQKTVSIAPWNAIPKMFPIFENVNTRLIGGRNNISGIYLSIISLVFVVWLFFNKKKINTKSKDAYILLLTWIFFGLIGLGLYKQEIYDHYYGFFFPAPFIFIGFLIQSIYPVAKKAGRILIIAGLCYLLFLNIKESPLRYYPNQQLRRAREVAEKVSQEVGDKEFNFAVIAERNYEAGYQYFLELWGKKVVKIDAQEPDTITDQLFVVCETEKDKCDPTHNSKAEVANFGWSRIESQWTIFGTTLYKLVHTK